MEVESASVRVPALSRKGPLSIDLCQQNERKLKSKHAHFELVEQIKWPAVEDSITLDGKSEDTCALLLPGT